jgi:hypothetical protein
MGGRRDQRLPVGHRLAEAGHPTPPEGVGCARTQKPLQAVIVQFTQAAL